MDFFFLASTLWNSKDFLLFLIIRMSSLLILLFTWKNAILSSVIEGQKYLVPIWINLYLSMLLISLNHFITALVFLHFDTSILSSSNEVIFSIIFLVIFPFSHFAGFINWHIGLDKIFLYNPLVFCILRISLNSLFCH